MECHVVTEYVYLDAEERRRFAAASAEDAGSPPPPPPPPPPIFFPTTPTCCAICLRVDAEARQRFGHRCGHTFHANCLEPLRWRYPRAPCPLCPIAN